MRDAAMSSIALVIFLVDCTDLIRRRKTRCWAPTGYLLTVSRSGKNTCWYGPFAAGLQARGVTTGVGRVGPVSLDRLLALTLERLRLGLVDLALLRTGLEGLLEVVDRVDQLLLDLVTEQAGGGDVGVDALVLTGDEVEEVGLEPADVA